MGVRIFKIEKDLKLKVTRKQNSKKKCIYKNKLL
jgi:hypothetical protein